MQIFDELHTGHLKLLSMMDELLDMPDHEDEEYRANLISDIQDQLIPHTRAEELVFYNSLRACKVASELICSSFNQHRELEALVQNLSSDNKANRDWRNAAERLRDALAHHVREEELQVFPVARRLLDSGTVEQIGRAFVDLKNEIHGETIFGSDRYGLDSKTPLDHDKLDGAPTMAPNCR